MSQSSLSSGHNQVDDAATNSADDCKRKPVLRRTKAGRFAAEISRAELEQFFFLPVQEASEQLGVGVTVLKSVCRKFDISRWPFRKVRRIQWLAEKLQVGYGTNQDRAALVGGIDELGLSPESQLWKNMGVDIAGALSSLPKGETKRFADLAAGQSASSLGSAATLQSTHTHCNAQESPAVNAINPTVHGASNAPQPSESCARPVPTDVPSPAQRHYSDMVSVSSNGNQGVLGSWIKANENGCSLLRQMIEDQVCGPMEQKRAPFPQQMQPDVEADGVGRLLAHLARSGMDVEALLNTSGAPWAGDDYGLRKAIDSAAGPVSHLGVRQTLLGETKRDIQNQHFGDAVSNLGLAADASRRDAWSSHPSDLSPSSMKSPSTPQRQVTSPYLMASGAAVTASFGSGKTPMEPPPRLAAVHSLASAATSRADTSTTDWSTLYSKCLQLSSQLSPASGATMSPSVPAIARYGSGMKRMSSGALVPGDPQLAEYNDLVAAYHKYMSTSRDTGPHTMNAAHLPIPQLQVDHRGIRPDAHRMAGGAQQDVKLLSAYQKYLQLSGTNHDPLSNLP